MAFGLICKGGSEIALLVLEYSKKESHPTVTNAGGYQRDILWLLLKRWRILITSEV